MYCEKCGNKLGDTDKFCDKCGAKVEPEFVPVSTNDNLASVDDKNSTKEVPAKPVSTSKVNSSGDDKPTKFDPYDKNNSLNKTEIVNENVVKSENTPDKGVTTAQNTVKQSQATTKQAQTVSKQTQNVVKQTQTIVTNQNQAKKEKKKMSKGGKAILAIAIILTVVIIGALVGLGVTKSMHSPAKAAEEFSSYLLNQDWDNVYENINMQESQFVNKELFITMCNDDSSVFGADLSNVADSKLVTNDLGDNGGASCTLTVYSNSSSSGSINFTAVKDVDGFWFFDTYKFVLDKSPIESYTVYAPKDSTVKVNNIEITAMGEDQTAYPINAILPGKYSLSVSHDNCQDYTADFTVYPSSLYEDSENYGEGYGYYDTEKNKLVNGSYKGSNLYEVALLFTTDYEEELNSQIEAKAKKIANDIKSGEYSISEYELTLDSFDDVEKQLDSAISKIHKYDSNTSTNYTYTSPKLKTFEEKKHNSNKLYMSTYGLSQTHEYKLEYLVEETYTGTTLTQKTDHTFSLTLSISITLNQDNEIELDNIVLK